jgi:hypothetical protein
MKGPQQAESSFTDFAGGNLPHSIEAEQCLLGAILVNNEAYGFVSRLITPEDLFEPIHQKIYAVAGDLFSAGKLATPVTIENHLPADLDIPGTPLGQYLAKLCAEATTVINATDYAKIIYDLKHRREVIAIGEELRAIAASSPVDFSPDMLAQQTIERLGEIVTARTETHVPPRAYWQRSGSSVLGHGARRQDRRHHRRPKDPRQSRGRSAPWAACAEARRPGIGKSGLMQSCAPKAPVRMLVFKALASERRAVP